MSRAIEIEEEASLIQEEKRHLRLFLRERRRAYQGESRRRSEVQIVNELRGLIAQYSKGYIGVYYPFDGEVDISMLWGGGFPITLSHPDPLISRFVFPKHQSAQALSFIRPSKWSESRSLPIADGEPVHHSELSLILIPGVAFDQKTGLRVGLGGGHYDRTLSLYAQRSWTISAFGVGFNFQQRAKLPNESWDVPLNGLVTEHGTHLIQPDAVVLNSSRSLNERETP